MSASLRERLLPWLLVLPALLFATPLSPLALDPYPHLAGTGWAVLALLPLALLLLRGGPLPRPAWLLLATLAWALLSWRRAGVTDTFEARRALLVLCVLALALAGGAGLDGAGRARFAWLCVLLGIVWTAQAIGSGFAGGSFAGVLGDTGSLSQAALPGAAIGALWLARGTGRRRFAGGLALALFLVHVAAAPVLAGAHTLLAGLLLALWRCPGATRGRLAALALGALLAPFAGLALRQVATGERPSVEGAPSAPAHSLGGLGVRALVWQASLGLLGDHAWLGAGPGQFQAAFPPYRDPEEIELSRHGACSELDTEVEHAHNDWLQALCELGLPGGLLFALALLSCARAAWRGLTDEGDRPLAVAALALLVNSLVHAPLWANPAAAVLAAALLGALAGARASGSRRGAAVAVLPALLAVPAALPLVRHGAALRAQTEAARALEQLAREASPAERALEDVARASLRAIERAGSAAPDSVPGLALAARSRARDPAGWDAVLARRPHMVEAWEQSATILARAGHLPEARARYARALALSPTHPRILRNAARLEWTQGDEEPGLAFLERLRASDCLRTDWLEALGAELVLQLGRPARGARLLHGQPLDTLVPEALHERARADPPAPAGARAGAAEADECLAQLLWGRAHATAGSFDTALRNYRQAAQRSAAGRAAGSRDPAPLYALELAAAEVRAGRTVEAQAALQGIAADRATWSELPSWAWEALEALGMRPEEQP